MHFAADFRRVRTLREKFIKAAQEMEAPKIKTSKIRNNNMMLNEHSKHPQKVGTKFLKN